MRVLDDLFRVAIRILAWFFITAFGVLFLLVILALPLLGLTISMVNLWISVPATVILSMVALASLFAIAYWTIDEVRN